MTHLFEHENISREEVIYVGDEIRDIEASRKAGVPVIAVSWGLNNGKIPESIKPDQIAYTPKDLLSCIRKITT
jgi:phosphoglycolate phosphatase-like HAD superfamily hydrolase